MAKQIQALVLLAAVLLSFWAGWEWRDRSADLTVAKRDTADAQGATVAVTAARAGDHANNATAATTEQARVTAAARTDGAFSAIDNQVNDYAKDYPRTSVRTATAPPVCVDGAVTRVAAVLPDDPVRDARFLRAWNAANAGHPAPEPGHPSGAAATRD